VNGGLATTLRSAILAARGGTTKKVINVLVEG